jgi:glycerol-3-phosphate dehydrogenase (NAD(P)+)
MGKQTRIAVIGAGAWGSAVAKSLAYKSPDYDVAIWCYEPETAKEINEQHTNGKFLPGAVFPANLYASNDIISTVDGRDYVILAIPSLFLLNTVKQMLAAPSIREGQTMIAVITKGFMEGPAGPRLIVETLEGYLPGFYRGQVVYISGPSHAEEVAQGKLTGLVAASEKPKNAIRMRYLLKTKRLLVYPSLDVKGVQVAAAAKNVIAIAFGMMDAIKEDPSLSGALSGGENIFGDNTESLLLAAGLNEMLTLGVAMGATHRETFTSIAGVGDLDVTCRSIYGRNRRFGREIVEKDILAPFTSLDDFLKRVNEIGYLPEGAAAVRYVKQLTDKHRLYMPICNGVFRILNREITPAGFVESFLGSLD